MTKNLTLFTRYDYILQFLPPLSHTPCSLRHLLEELKRDIDFYKIFNFEVKIFHSFYQDGCMFYLKRES